MSITASKLRSDIFNLLDGVLETGKPLEIERKGRKLMIVPEKPVDLFKNMKKRDLFKCDPKEIIHLDWSSEWKP